MKKSKLFAALTTGVLLCTALPAVPAAAELPGDADYSGTVNTADVVKVSRYLLQLDRNISASADMDKNGRIDAFDLAALKRSLLTPQPQNPPVSDDAVILINEVCASNKESLLDSTGRAADWVELYNSGSQPVSLAGYGLSDGTKNPYKFTFPENAAVPAGGYVIVFCDDGLTESTDQEYHAPFKLSAEGEQIYLVNASGTLVDSVNVPLAVTDVTYGRLPNGGEAFSSMTPTPGKSNDSATKELSAPAFSAESGFYDAEFTLDITCDNGTEIWYTTDGTDPTTSATAKKYTEGLKIYNNTNEQNVLSAKQDISLDSYAPPSNPVDKGIVIRAAAKSADGQYSTVATESYFVGKTAAYYKDMLVVSIVTDPSNLFDSQTGIYVIGDAYNQWRNSPEYKRLDNWDTQNPTNYNQSGKEWERPVYMQVFGKGKLKYETGAGMRISGNATRVNFQKSLRLYARSDYGDSKFKYAFFDDLTSVNGEPIENFSKLTLRNGGNDITEARFRDDLVHELVKDRNISVQATENAIVFIDGEFWGMYTLRERLDDAYVASHFDVKKSNVTTIKCGEIEGDETVGRSYEEFYNWAMNADLSDDANYQKVCDTIDMQSFMDYMTVETYINNYDFSNSQWVNNWQMWRANTPEEGNPYTDGKWRFMLYDTEYSSALYNQRETAANYNMISNMYREQNWQNLASLFYRLLKNEKFCTEFTATYKEIVGQNFQYDKVNTRITQFVTEQQDAYKDTNKRFYGWNADRTNGNYNNNVENVRNFYRSRSDQALQQLEQVIQNKGEGSQQGPGQNPWNPWNQWG